MSIASDTENLLDPTLWGEIVTVVRNTVTHDSAGMASDSWASVATPLGDIQPMSGTNPIVITTDAGENRTLTHRIFMPTGTNIKQGDRVRKNGWVAGDDEFIVEGLLDEEGHIETRTRIISGHG